MGGCRRRITLLRYVPGWARRGYYAPASGTVSHADLSGKFRRNRPNPVPVCCRLAVDRKHRAAGWERTALERQEFLRGLNGDYQRPRKDPELWERYLAERHEWDTLASSGEGRSITSISASQSDTSQPFAAQRWWLSVDVLNNGPGGLVVVVPITTAGYAACEVTLNLS
jgi:hypothetical protein